MEKKIELSPAAKAEQLCHLAIPSLSARKAHSTLTTSNLTRSQKSINYERDAICNFPLKEESTNELDWIEEEKDVANSCYLSLLRHMIE